MNLSTNSSLDTLNPRRDACILTAIAGLTKQRTLYMMIMNIKGYQVQTVPQARLMVMVEASLKKMAESWAPKAGKLTMTSVYGARR